MKRYKIPKLAELLLRDHMLRDVQRWYHPDLVVMDGSPLLNLVAWAMLFKEASFGEELCTKVISFFTASRSPANLVGQWHCSQVSRAGRRLCTGVGIGRG